MTEPPGRAALHKLLDVLASRPSGAFERIGGPVSFFVKRGDDSSEHHFAIVDEALQLCGGKPASWAVRIGISESALEELVAGTLDVQKAVADNRLAIDADAPTLARFAAAFMPAASALDVRLRR
jgi:hypothetical protein